MKKSRIIITVIAIILIIIIIAVVAITVRNVNTNVLENHEFYQYYSGKKVTYEGTIVLESQDNISQITTNDSKIQLDSTPMYYVDIKDKVIFPKNMAAVYPVSGGLMYKINRFANVIMVDKTIYLERETSNKSLENAFLYDGSDLYFFLENTKIKVGEEEYEVTPLSYASVQYNGSVEIYNKGQDEYKIFEGNYKDVLAQTENYTINMSIDAIQYGEKQQLLIKNVDNLKNLE